MPAQTAGEDLLLRIATLTLHVRSGVLVGDTHDVLLNDRAVVEVLGGVVAGGTDELHTTSISLQVRARAHERRQEAVVDIDCAAFPLLAQIRRQNLHEACEHDGIRVFGVDDLCDLIECLTLTDGILGEGHMVERNVIRCD